MKADKIKVVVLVFVLLGLGFNGCVGNIGEIIVNPTEYEHESTQLTEMLYRSLEYGGLIQSEFIDLFIPIFAATENSNDVIDLFLTQFDSYIYFYEFDIQYVKRWTLIPNVDMKDFRFVEVDHLPIHLYGDERERNHLYKVGTLFEMF